ncbi:MAG: lipopolysaccharide heptosyltransferase II [Kiritimatiellia bacterium]
MTIGRQQRILICGTNWLGDSIMSMPAVQMFKRQNPATQLALLVKPNLIPLWELQPAVDELIRLDTGFQGTLATVCRLRDRRFDRAYIFPNSFRAAALPFLARVPVRRGFRGHARAWLLTELVRVSPTPERIHQAWEYVAILDILVVGGSLESPRLNVTQSDAQEVMRRLRLNGSSGQFIGMAPGAARGPSKRWPASHFAACGRLLADSEDFAILVFGTAPEAELCSFVATQIGPRAYNLAGKTTLRELAALLTACRAVVANDSGCMHLATAVGTPVVAVFGITEPAKTGPLGRAHRIITREVNRRSRDIRRRSAEAEQCLREIEPEEVAAAVRSLLENPH